MDSDDGLPRLRIVPEPPAVAAAQALRHLRATLHAYARLCVLADVRYHQNRASPVLPRSFFTWLWRVGRGCRPRHERAATLTADLDRLAYWLDRDALFGTERDVFRRLHAFELRLVTRRDVPLEDVIDALALCRALRRTLHLEPDTVCSLGAALRARL
jgi:hypothetical protein